MALGEIIRCSSLDEVLRKAVELQQSGIKTEFVSSYTLRVVSVATV